MIPVVTEISLLTRGMLLGLMIAAPVGPIGLLCIRRTVSRGLISGLFTGLGAALADGIFAAIAVLGIAAIMDFISHYSPALKLLGGSFLILGAWHTWHDPPAPPPELHGIAEKVVGLAPDKEYWRIIRAFVSGLAITLTNPISLFGTLAVVATFGGQPVLLEAISLVLGIFAGSALWWFLLCGGVSLLRTYFTEARIVIINRFTAVILTILALWAIISGALRLLHNAGFYDLPHF